MEKKQIAVLSGLAAAVVLVIAVGVLTRSGGEAGRFVGGGNGLTPGGDTENPEEEQAPRFYSAEVPENAAPTPPVHESPAAPNVEARLGFFEMKVSAAGFTPAELTVKQGNLVQIKITALDDDYDWHLPYLGLSLVVRKGETKQASFQVTAPGTYRFECRDYCPIGRTIGGELVVIP